jgi:DNA polymerase-3 subunit alpha/error-prone DNA polymerase
MWNSNTARYSEKWVIFGLPKEELDALAKKSNYTILICSCLGTEIRHDARKYPNQRSMHSCGILISEEPITNYTVLEMPPKGFPLALFTHC